MKVLSLFDGMSCTRIALDKLDIKLDSYYASEVDKYAIKVSQANYPSINQLGDVTKWRTWDIDWSTIDLVVAGFPCQSWSLAGQGLGDKDKRGQLFWTTLDIIKHVLKNNPKANYLMENVKMKKDFEDYITYHTEQALGTVQKYLINSSLVSAQNRKRFYWTNILNVNQPKDKNIVLADVLEEEVDAKFLAGKNLIKNYRGGNQLNPNYKSQANTIHDHKSKSGVLCAGTHGYANGYVQGCIQVGEADIKGFDIIKRVYSPEGKAPTLTTMGGGHREPKVACGSMIGRRINPETGKRDDYNEDIKPVQRIEIRADSKTGTLTTVQKDNLVVSPIRDKSKTVRSGGRGSYDRHEWDSVDKLHWRKLTPLECERLQTVPDNYTNHVSNTQRYKMLGNGFTVDVISHILKHI
jgi:DNA-cytosine methyltransferase